MLPKVTADGFKASFGVPVPVPERETALGDPNWLPAMLTTADSPPTREGVNVTAMLQLPPAASTVPQLLESRKSALFGPPTWRLEMVRFAVPVLVRTTVV